MSESISELLDQIASRLQEDKDVEVEVLRQRVLQIAAGAEGQDLASIAEELVNDAVLFAHVDQAKQAEPFFTRLLSLMEQRFGPEHALTLKALSTEG